MMYSEIVEALNQLTTTMKFIAVILVIIALKDMSGSESISLLQEDIARKLDEIIREFKEK